MTGRADRKRPASEPVEALLSHAEGSPAPLARPLSTTLGALFVFLRVIAGLLWMGAFMLIWPTLAAEENVPVEDRPLMFWLVLGVGVIASLISLLLAWSIWRGSNAARVLVMFGVTISTLTSAIGYFSNGEEITIHTTLLTVALDILVLLALSSRDARAWSRKPRAAAESAGPPAS